MKKNIWLFVSLSLLLIGSFAFWASCNEIQNSTNVWDECYCKEWFAWNKWKTQCIKIDTSSRDAELKKAIERMYENWLTQYNTPESFKSDDYLTREQASKFFVTFYSKILGKKVTWNLNLNAFSDINNADPDLKIFIAQANDMWLFKGSKWKFMPKNKLTQAQAIAVAIRMVNWNQKEIENSRYVNYYNKAKKYWLLKRWNFDIVDLNRINITRWDTALILYALNNHITNSKDSEKLINYNNNLANALNKCLDIENDNISTFDSWTEEEMNNAITQILNVCEDSAKEVRNIWPRGDDDSLEKAVLTVISYNILFYNKAKEIVPYKHIKNLTEEQEIESDKIDKELENFIKDFDKAFENLKAIQKEFSDNYNF